MRKQVERWRGRVGELVQAAKPEAVDPEYTSGEILWLEFRDADQPGLRWL